MVLHEISRRRSLPFIIIYQEVLQTSLYYDGAQGQPNSISLAGKYLGPHSGHLLPLYDLFYHIIALELKEFPAEVPAYHRNAPLHLTIPAEAQAFLFHGLLLFAVLFLKAL